jgi:hypothetical protein
MTDSLDNLTINALAVPASAAPRPTADEKRAVAEALEQVGFRVLRTGIYGVSVAGAPQSYQELLGTNGPYVGTYSVQGELRSIVDSLEFTPLPILFAGKDLL